MSWVRIVRKKLKDFGFRSDLSHEVEKLGLQLTACQMIVVVLSMVSVVFMFAPLLFIQDVRFMAIFLGLSLLFLMIGVWFWVKRHEICEHPEEIQD